MKSLLKPSSRIRAVPKNNHNWFKTQDITKANLKNHSTIINNASYNCTERPSSPAERRPSASSKSTNPPSDQEASSFEDDGEWGFHSNLEEVQVTGKTFRRSVNNAINEEGELFPTKPIEPRRRYSADDVDYLKHAMFILECEQSGVDVNYNTASPVPKLLVQVKDCVSEVKDIAYEKTKHAVNEVVRVVGTDSYATPPSSEKGFMTPPCLSFTGQSAFHNTLATQLVSNKPERSHSMNNSPIRKSEHKKIERAK